MIRPSTASPEPSLESPTIWGLSPAQLHDRFWAARGVQVVRQGEPSEIVGGAELFLLTDPRTLAIFKLSRPVDILNWIKPDLLYVRLHDGRDHGYREYAIAEPDGRFIRFQRVYRGLDSRLARVALTPERRLAQLWQKSPDARLAWDALREEVPRAHRSVVSIQGSVYDRMHPNEVMPFVRELVKTWRRPDSTVSRAVRRGSGAWTDRDTRLAQGVTLIGSVWIGAGRMLSSEHTVVGPALLWDDPQSRPAVDTLSWERIEPTVTFQRPVKPRQRNTLSLATKRAFDVLFATLMLLLTMPLYPLVMLAIWLEDRSPFFFVHRRETIGGREFGCIKFRSMRRNAEEFKAKLVADNQADGPQFYMEDDPRLTRVGRFIRKTYVDELPQFINVLLGHMSVVGPRPSPFQENQYCPPWREARLSVRPGITGLWQVRRTRRKGLDFQEWIKYDIEYVENASWRLDLRIIWETAFLIIRGIMRA